MNHIAFEGCFLGAANNVYIQNLKQKSIYTMYLSLDKSLLNPYIIFTQLSNRSKLPIFIRYRTFFSVICVTFFEIHLKFNFNTDNIQFTCKINKLMILSVKTSSINQILHILSANIGEYRNSQSQYYNLCLRRSNSSCMEEFNVDRRLNISFTGYLEVK